MTPTVAVRAVPWVARDLLLVSAMNAVGLVLLVVGWFGASSTTSVRTEANWLSLALAGVVVAGAGDGLWLLAGLRTVAHRRRVVLARRPDKAMLDVDVDLDAGWFVAGDGMTRFHIQGCPAAAGRAGRPATRRAHESAGRRPCGLCVDYRGPADA